MGRYDIRALAAVEHTDVKRPLAKNGIITPVRALAFGQDFPEVFDSGGTGFRITRMRGPATYSKVRHHRAFLGARQPVFGRLTHDDVFGMPLQRIGGLGSRAVRLLANHKQVSEICGTVTAKPVSGFEHRCDDSLRVACSSSEKILVVFANRQNRRDSVDVSAQNNPRVTREPEYIESVRRHDLPFNPITKARNVRRKEFANCSLGTGHGCDRHQLTGQFEWIHRYVRSRAAVTRSRANPRSSHKNRMTPSRSGGVNSME